MHDDQIPKDSLYDELATGTRPTGKPLLRFKDVCKRDLNSDDIHSIDLESTTADRNF